MWAKPTQVKQNPSQYITEINAYTRHIPAPSGLGSHPSPLQYRQRGLSTISPAQTPILGSRLHPHRYGPAHSQYPALLSFPWRSLRDEESSPNALDSLGALVAMVTAPHSAAVGLLPLRAPPRPSPRRPGLVRCSPGVRARAAVVAMVIAAAETSLDQAAQNPNPPLLLLLLPPR